MKLPFDLKFPISLDDLEMITNPTLWSIKKGANLAKKMNETEPCECSHGRPFHYFEYCSEELSKMYIENGFKDGMCHHASHGETAPAKCGCFSYKAK